MEVESVAAATGAGGVLLGLIITKLLNRTADNIEGLPKLYWRVEALEKANEALVKRVGDLERENQAGWRELAKVRDWVDNSIGLLAELAERNGMIPLNPPKWGKEP